MHSEAHVLDLARRMAQHVIDDIVAAKMTVIEALQFVFDGHVSRLFVDEADEYSDTRGLYNDVVRLWLTELLWSYVDVNHVTLSEEVEQQGLEHVAGLHRNEQHLKDLVHEYYQKKLAGEPDQHWKSDPRFFARVRPVPRVSPARRRDEDEMNDVQLPSKDKKFEVPSHVHASAKPLSSVRPVEHGTRLPSGRWSPPASARVNASAKPLPKVNASPQLPSSRPSRDESRFNASPQPLARVSSPTNRALIISPARSTSPSSSPPRLPRRRDINNNVVDRRRFYASPVPFPRVSLPRRQNESD